MQILVTTYEFEVAEHVESIAGDIWDIRRHVKHNYLHQKYSLEIALGVIMKSLNCVAAHVCDSTKKTM